MRLFQTTNRNGSTTVLRFLMIAVATIVTSAQSGTTTCDIGSGGGITVGDNNDVLIQNIVNEQDQTVTIQMTYAGLGWVGFAFSTSTSMVPATAVIGLPDDNLVSQYSMTEKSQSGVTEVTTSTLTTSSIEQNTTHTVLKFTKPLSDSNDNGVQLSTTGDNTFIWGVGSSNALSYHSSRGSSTITLNTCGGGGTTPTTGTSPSAPVQVPAPAPTTSATGSYPAPTEDNEDDSSPSGSSSNGTSSSSGINKNGGYENTFAVADGAVVVGISTDPTSETITIEMTYAGLGWISIAFSEDGNMIGSAAVIGTTASGKPQKYDMKSKANDGVILASDARQATLTDGIFTQNDTHTYMKFTRPLVDANEPTVSLDRTIKNKFLYAYGFSNDLSFHADRGNFALALAACDPNSDTDCSTAVEQQEAANHSLWLGHGVCMGLAWAILIPLAIGSSLLRNLLPTGGIWFQLHRGLNMLGIVLTIIGFGLAVAAINKEVGSSKNQFSENSHRKLGLVIFILALIQAINGILRPHAPANPAANTTTTPTKGKTDPSTEDNDDENPSSNNNNTSDSDDNNHGSEEKTTLRLVWEIGHRLLGVAILGMAWYNCYTGIDWYEIRFDTDATGLLWGFVGGISGTILILFVYQFIKSSKY